MAKGQASVIVILFGVIFIIAMIFFLIFILKTVNDYRDIVTNNTLDSSNENIPDIDLGESIKGSTKEEKEELIKDPNIAPPELAG